MASVTEVGTSQYPEDVRTSYGVDATGKPVTIEQRTVTQSYAVPMNNNNGFARLDPETLAVTQPQTRIFLKPIAMPSCLGMAAFFAGTWCFSTWLCGWYHIDSQYEIFPFVFFLGGLAQFISGFYGFPARDNLATVFHVSWGSFYMAYGFYILLYVLGYLTNATTGIVFTPFSYNTDLGEATWLVVMAAITWTVCLASLGRDFLIFLITLLQAVGCTIMFAGYYALSVTGAVKTGAYFMMVSSLCALCYVFVTLIADAALSNQDQALYNNNANRAPGDYNNNNNNRASNFRNRLTSWHGVLPWQPTSQSIRIPLAEPGIKKGQ